MRALIIPFIFLFLLQEKILAQNLDKIGEKDVLSVNGGLNYNSTIYFADGMPARRDPFAWFLSGNVNFSILDWSIPFSYSYSNQHGTFTQPFNQYCIAPQYKWIKTFFGYTSMNFSKYTLAGHTFLGGGAELSPKNWKFAVMYGRLKKAVEYDVLNNSETGMSYRRMGFGAKAGYSKDAKEISLIFFHATDDPTSLAFIPSASLIKPMENTAISVSGKYRFGKHFMTEMEYALSGLTRDLLSDEEPGGERKNYFPGIFTMHSTSQFFHAMKGSVGYQVANFKLNLNYERIDPDYQTLGAYYFTNDAENITIAPTLLLFKNKLTVTANTGLQRNNLDKTKLSTMTRWAGSMNISFVPNPHFAFNGSYSNFTSYTRMRPKDDPYFQNTLDTLNFYQLSQNANLNANYNFGNQKLKHAINLSYSYMVSGEKHGVSSDVISLYGNGAAKIPSVVMNGNLGYNLNFVRSKTSMIFSVNTNRSSYGINATTYLGPNFGFAKSFCGGKLRCNAGTSFNKVYSSNTLNGTVMNNRIGSNFTPKLKNEKFGKPTIGMNASCLTKFNQGSRKIQSNEITILANISYAF